MMGKSGVLGGDIIGAFTHIFHDYAGVIGAAGIDAAVNTASALPCVCSGVLIPLINGAYGSVLAD